MATLARRFTSITQELVDELENSSDWSPTGAADLPTAVGATSNGTSIYASCPMSDAGSLYTKRFLLGAPSSYVPVFSTITGVSLAYAASTDDDTGVPVLGGSGSTEQHRAWNSVKGDSWITAGSGTTGGLRTNAVDTLGVRTTFTHATWQASGVTNYLGSNAGRLNAGWTHALTGYLSAEAGQANVLLDSVVETITYTAPSAPAAFALSAPADTSTGVSRTPLIDWNASTRAVHYRVRISVNSDMSSPIVDAETTKITLESQTADHEYQVATPLAAGTLYYVRVDALNYAGPDSTSQQTTACTADFSFTTQAAAVNAGLTVGQKLLLLDEMR